MATINQYDVFNLAKDISPTITKGMEGVILNVCQKTLLKSNSLKAMAQTMSLRARVHPVLESSGLPLFENIRDRTIFKLVRTKTFTGGAVTLYYEPTKNG